MDSNCLLTGISLRGIDVTAVVLRQHGDDYRPIAFGIRGSHNGFGGIEEVDADLNTELIARYFVAKSSDGTFAAGDRSGAIDGSWPAHDRTIEDFLATFDQTHLAIFDDFCTPHCTLDGDRIVFALIAQPIWDAIVDEVEGTESSEHTFGRLFGAEPASSEIYRDRLPEFTAALAELATIDDFVHTHDLRWAPPPDQTQRYTDSYGQHDKAEIEEFLRRAKNDYRDTQEIQAGLSVYAQIVADYLAEDSDEQQPSWAPDDYSAELLTEIPVQQWPQP
ncbi:hypothetical protein [Nocardia salmonicida]